MRRSRSGFSLLLAGSLLFSAPALANDPLAAFGGYEGLHRIAIDTLDRSMADPRLRPFFVEQDRPDIAKKLADQFCQELGGPCTYKGKDMKKAHAKQEIGMQHFNALVEVLQDSMDAAGVPFRDQNRLLARLAPMYRDMVRD